MIRSLLFRHGFTARFARVAEIAEKFFLNFLLSPTKEQQDMNKFETIIKKQGKSINETE